jgi:hypothetical protein
MCPDYFYLDNFNADIKPPWKSHQRLTQTLEDYNRTAHALNESKENARPITRPIKRYCPLDQSPLKPIKAKPVEGLSDISKPRYRCVLCKSVFEGFGLDLQHETKPSLKAITFEWDGTL